MVKFAFFCCIQFTKVCVAARTAAFVPRRPPDLSEGVVVATTAAQQSPKGNWEQRGGPGGPGPSARRDFPPRPTDGGKQEKMAPSDICIYFVHLYID